MQIFNHTLTQMLTMFVLISLGYLLRKKNVFPESSGTIMARMETFIFVPALSLFVQMTRCSVENFKENFSLIFYGFIIVICSIIIAHPLSKYFIKKGDNSPENLYQRNVYKYALTFGNYGFMGNYIVLGVWGNEFLYKYLLFTFLVGIFCNGWGLYILIPKEQNASIWKNLKKGLVTPPIIALVVGVVLGLLDFDRFVPQFILNSLENAGNCQGPVAMILAGFVIGGYNFKELISNKKVYVATFLRLIFFPSIIMLILMLLGTSEEIMTLALIAFATPLGLNTIVYPAAYGGDTKTGASMAMISHTLSIITIPLMYLIFIVLL